MNTQSFHKKLVFGLGCGRSGSESLSQLLRSQDGSVYSHEFALFCKYGHRGQRFRAPLPWHAPPEIALDAARLVMGYPANVVGDVGSSWLPHLPKIWEQFPDAKAVCIKRSRDAVIGSFVKKTSGRNHWQARSANSDWEPDPLWDPFFPTYQAKDKAEAIGQYWDEYYATAEDFAQQYPHRFRCWDISALLNSASAREILTFATDFPSNSDVKLPRQRNRSRSRVSRIARGWARNILTKLTS